MTVAGTGEQFARTGEIELAYETFGDRGDPAVLMIMGLGSQMIAWPDELCGLIAERGYFVIRFDNRDCGRSTKLDGSAVPLTRLRAVDPETVPYRLRDMATDAVGLLDALGIGAAHFVGASLGGMIAQRAAIDHPERVLSLASIMSTTGDHSVGRPTDAAREVLLTRLPSDRAGCVESFLAARRVIGSPGFARDDARTRSLAERAFDRGLFPDGTARQFAAIFADGDRTPELGRIAAPTVVIHGADDPLIGVSGGEATADAIPGADLVVVEGMGHDLPEGSWGLVADALTANFERAASLSRA